MCSIFHNRINYRGPSARNGGGGNGQGSGGSPEGGLGKELDSDRNNNGGGAGGSGSGSGGDDVLAIEAAIGEASTIMTAAPMGNGNGPANEHSGSPSPRHRRRDDDDDPDNGPEPEEGHRNHDRQMNAHAAAHEDDAVTSGGGREDDECHDDSNEALDLSLISTRCLTKADSRGGGAGHVVALEALQNTKVAVAQFAATAIANSPHSYPNGEERAGDPSGGEGEGVGGDDLAMVQSTILNVQRQHFMQLQWIQHLQSQLKRAAEAQQQQQEQPGDSLPLNDDEEEEDEAEARHEEQKEPRQRSSRVAAADVEEPSADEKGVCTRSRAAAAAEKSKTDEKKAPVEAPSVGGGEQQQHYLATHQSLMGDISSSLASSIITNHDPPPLPNEPNCLEMLQRRTEEVLDSASQSVHATQLQEEYEYAQKDALARGEIFKHRCKYCGKIFGSYSALQIHLRSHTGERPFHCNVCGSKFTTKGNLKVHYQRHTQIFPPIMLGGPMAEHFANQFQGQGAPAGGPIAPPPPPQALPPLPPPPPPPPPSSGARPSAYHGQRSKTPESPEREESEEKEREKVLPPESPQSLTDLGSPDDNPQDLSKAKSPPAEKPKPEPLPLTPTLRIKTPHEIQETASSKSPPAKEKLVPPPTTPKRNGSVRKRNYSTGTPPSEGRKGAGEADNEHLAKLLRRSSFRGGSSSHGADGHVAGDYSLAQMERIIDKSWEDLIEIDKTSETSKLQQLVDNIENKLTDPNQCVFCQKVMSCRSSLQMHIRTHTGERPFRCKICGRAFATKGNLKAHMSIHKIKPPMRSQFKCPVCHQKFSNGIILQQHIRIHTIDEGAGPSGGHLSNGDDHHGRLKGHSDYAVEDQNSQKSLGASENFDLSTTSEYSGQRSESSQGDFDDFMTMDSTDDSRENSSSTTPFRRHGDDYGAGSVEAEKAERAGEGGDREQASSVAHDAMDLTAAVRAYGDPTAGGSLASKALEALPQMLGAVPPNFLLMAAAREEMQHKFPMLPFGPLSLMGLHHHPHICHFCFKMFPNAATLETHTQTEHTKEVATPTPPPPLAATGPPPPAPPRPTSSSSSSAAAMPHNATNNSSSNNNASNCDRTSSPYNPKLTLNPHLFAKKFDDDTESLNQKAAAAGKDENSNEADDEPPAHIKQEQEGDAAAAAHQDNFDDRSHREDDQSPSLLPPEYQPPPQAMPIDAEQSLMKMQMQAHRFPASPLDFQQALMSVGPPSQNVETPMNQKHFCHVCRRNFSSSSALQIHMRTHTGDKPFQCNVCQKAFTTKGNLKVHMGTHMWTNPTSRRGRRMSLEIPVHRPGSLPSESDFIQRRPELFFPYLPPFFNGLSAKSGELSPTGFPNIPVPPFAANGNGLAGKFPPMAFPQFLGPAAYNFSAMQQMERSSSRSPGTPQLNDEGGAREGSRSPSLWNPMMQIKTEHQQDDGDEAQGDPAKVGRDDPPAEVDVQ